MHIKELYLLYLIINPIKEKTNMHVLSTWSDPTLHLLGKHQWGNCCSHWHSMLINCIHKALFNTLKYKSSPFIFNLSIHSCSAIWVCCMDPCPIISLVLSCSLSVSYLTPTSQPSPCELHGNRSLTLRNPWGRFCVSCPVFPLAPCPPAVFQNTPARPMDLHTVWEHSTFKGKPVVRLCVVPSSLLRAIYIRPNEGEMHSLETQSGNLFNLLLGFTCFTQTALMGLLNAAGVYIFYWFF